VSRDAGSLARGGLAAASGARLDARFLHDQDPFRTRSAHRLVSLPQNADKTLVGVGRAATSEEASSTDRHEPAATHRSCHFLRGQFGDDRDRIGVGGKKHFESEFGQSYVRRRSEDRNRIEE
jgi:hypothetical protein